MRSSDSTGWIWAAALGGMGLALLVLPFFGMGPIAPAALWTDPQGQTALIFWQLRLPRVLAGMVTGGALALAGLAFQAVFRNPLATPFTLGTASGASLGASVYLWAGASFAVFGLPGLTVAAFLGALAALGLVFLFSSLRGGTTNETMLLSGVAVSIFFSSLILMLQYFTNQTHSLKILRWLMGGLDNANYVQLLHAVIPTLAGLALVWLRRRDLNLLATGSDLAASRGMNVPQVKWLILTVCGFMVGAVVALAGPVGFIGLMSPHAARMILGPDHRRLVPAAFGLGAVFLPLCDTLARMLLAPAEVPVGIITALLGGPFFIWLLVRQSGPAH